MATSYIRRHFKLATYHTFRCGNFNPPPPPLNDPWNLTLYMYVSWTSFNYSFLSLHRFTRCPSQPLRVQTAGKLQDAMQIFVSSVDTVCAVYQDHKDRPNRKCHVSCLLNVTRTNLFLTKSMWRLDFYIEIIYTEKRKYIGLYQAHSWQCTRLQ